MLSTLKFSNVVKSAAVSDDPAATARTKFLTALTEQKSYAASRKGNTPFTSQKKVGGEMKDKRFNPWTFNVGGTLYTSLKYGSTVLSIEGNSSIECGKTWDEVIGVYDVVEKAAKDGELDKLLVAAAAGRSRKGKSAPAATPAAPAGKAKK